jgi:hypothetical protein
MKKETFNTLNSKGTELEVTVGIKHEGYGWFEVYDTKTGGEYIYCEGGLWFDTNEGVTYLTDYDGIFELPEYIMDKLVEWGYSMDWI